MSIPPDSVLFGKPDGSHSSKMLLNDEEIQYIIGEGRLKHSALEIPQQRQAIDRDIAKAQLKKVVEWLGGLTF